MAAFGELHSLLGDGVPLGHALKLCRVFAESAQVARQPRPRIPAGAVWQPLSRMQAVGVCDGKLPSSFTLIQELTIIASSLYVSLCLPVLLDLPTECASQDVILGCHTLRSVNAILWAIATACFVCSTGAAWIVLIVVQAVSDKCLAKWFEDHYRHCTIPSVLFVNGVTVTPVAVCSLLLIGP